MKEYHETRGNQHTKTEGKTRGIQLKQIKDNRLTSYVSSCNPIQRQLEIGGKRVNLDISDDEIKREVGKHRIDEKILETIKAAIKLPYAYRFDDWTQVRQAAERVPDPDKWLKSEAKTLLDHSLKSSTAPIFIDDRHGIIPCTEYPEQWGASIITGRVADLFKTAAGLPGHVQQINQILANAKKEIESADPPLQKRIIEQMEKIKHFICNEALKSTFDFGLITVDFYVPLTLKKEKGKLL